LSKGNDGWQGKALRIDIERTRRGVGGFGVKIDGRMEDM